MNRFFLIVAVMFALVAGGFTLAVAQDATPEANVGGTACPTGLADASPMAMASPVAMAEGTPVLAACATPEMGMVGMGTPTS